VTAVWCGVLMCSEFYWANYATGLGAALHELGHTFDLAHSPTGIMARGFDDINRFFTVQPSITNGHTNVRSSPPRPPASPARTAATVVARSRNGSVGDGVPCSRDSSPIPYSPKQSPVRRPVSVGFAPNSVASLLDTFKFKLILSLKQSVRL
jgi:Putative peptidase family